MARMIEEYRTSMLITTPTFLGGILRVADKKKLSSLRLVFSGAEKCPEHLFAGLNDLCPQAVLCEGYGVTECSPVVAVNSIEKPRPGTIGRILPSMEWLLVNPETHIPVGPGESENCWLEVPMCFQDTLVMSLHPLWSMAGIYGMIPGIWFMKMMEYLSLPVG